MKRFGLALLVAGALVLALVSVSLRLGEDASSQRVDPYSNFVTAHLDVLGEPDVPIPDARFSRTIDEVTDLDGVIPALDACAGPVAVDLGDDHPVLVAEHDYCGGSVWMPKLETDDVVGLKGPGVEPGLYTAVEIKLVDRYKSKVEDMPDGDVVLQTCISRTEMVLVALRLADDTSA